MCNLGRWIRPPPPRSSNVLCIRQKDDGDKRTMEEIPRDRKASNKELCLPKAAKDFMKLEAATQHWANATERDSDPFQGGMDLLTGFPYYNTEFPPLSEAEFYNGWNESWAPESFYDSAQVQRVMTMVSMVIYSITLVLGTTGNGLVIFFTCFRMKKTVTTTWYLNLAMADFVFALSLSSEIAYLALDYHWTLGRLVCKLDSMLTFLNMFASIFFLTAISADRCLSVMCPIWALNHRTLRLASRVAACIWAAALALSLPYLGFRDTKHLPDGAVECLYTFGAEDDSELRSQRHLFAVTTEFTVGFAVPFAIILACYGAIIVKLRGRIFGRSDRSLKIIMAVVLDFFCSWFPYHFFSILETLEDDSLGLEKTLAIGSPLAHALFCLNSCLNPLLYTYIGTGCRAANGRSFLSSVKGAFREDWVPHPLSSNRSSSSASAVESTVV